MMKRNVHEEARELIALGNALADEQQAWLQGHLQECGSCNEYSETANEAVRALRSQPFAADSGFVRATQMRVRARAYEMHRRKERLWVAWVCCVAVTLSTAISTALLWRGFTWIEQQAHLSSAAWQIALAVLGSTPAVGTAILLLARGTYMADYDASL